MLVLSYFNIRNLRNADIIGKCNVPQTTISILRGADIKLFRICGLSLLR